MEEQEEVEEVEEVEKETMRGERWEEGVRWELGSSVDGN